MQLQPQNYFTVVRQIANHTDTSTYYVRAVVRNAYSDAIIDTLSLTDKGSQRFKRDWMVPADSSGQGFYISIVTSVYEDSGYTTKSANYGDEETTYLVQDRLSSARGGGGIDAYTLRRIVGEELDRRKQEFDLSPVTGAIGAMQREINRIPKELGADRIGEVLTAIKDIPPPEKVNLEPVLTAITDTQKAITDKPVTEPTDLSPVLSGVQQGSAAVSRDVRELKTMMGGVGDELVQQVSDAVSKAVRSLKLQATVTSAAPEPAKPKAEPQPKPVPFDLKKLAL